MARLIWLLIWEHDDDSPHWPLLMRWAVVGLAVMGIAAVIVWRVLT